MSVNSSGIPLFPGVEDTEDMFLATMEERDSDVERTFDIPHALFQYLKETNKIEYKSTIATHITRKYSVEKNGTVKDHSHFDDVDNTPYGKIEEAKYTYGHVVGTQIYSREEMTKNTGPEQLIDLIDLKEEDLVETMHDHFAKLLLGDQDSDGRRMMGLGRIMQKDAICGGLDPTKPGFAFHQALQIRKSNDAKYSLANDFRLGLRKANRALSSSKQGVHDVELVGEDVYDMHQQFAEDKLQLSLSDMKKQDAWGNYEMLQSKGKTIIYEPELPPKTAWLLNFNKGIKLRIHKGTNFQFQNWQAMEKKVAKKRDILLYACLYVKNRNANAKIEFA